MTIPRTVGDAIAIASTWIKTSTLPFNSAFIGGSVAYTGPDSPLNPASDVDCYLIVEGEPAAGKLGKITVDGVLLDVSWLAQDVLEAADFNAVFASLIHFGRIVTDSTGRLTRIKQRIDDEFESPEAIAMRLEDMRARIRPLATEVNQVHLPQPEQVMNWIFPATLATHIPLIKACAPLTVRKRFVAAKRVLPGPEYEQLLSLFGFDAVSNTQAQTWLDNTATLFDYAAPLVAGSSQFWASDIMADARSISIGGSQQLINCGLHREAIYWIIATQTRCLTILDDVGVDASTFLPAFEEMTGGLGIGTSERRAERTASILDWIEN